MQPAIVQAQRNVDSLQPDKVICAAHDMFCFTALAARNTGTMYTNLLGTFPIHSFKSMQYIFVAYIYDLNAILVRACCRLIILRTYSTRVFLAHPTKVRQYTCDKAKPLSQFWGVEPNTSSGYEVAEPPHHHLDAGLHSYVGVWYWTDQTRQIKELSQWTSFPRQARLLSF